MTPMLPTTPSPQKRLDEQQTEFKKILKYSCQKQAPRKNPPQHYDKLHPPKNSVQYRNEPHRYLVNLSKHTFKKFQLKLLNKNLHIQPQLGYINKTQQKLTKINHDIQKVERKIKLKSRFALK